MNSQIFSHCHESIFWTKCLFSALAAFFLHLVQAQVDSVYWLLFCLNLCDFLCGLGLALAHGEFEFKKFKGGAGKLLGYILLIVPLVLADHFLESNPHVNVYLYLKNWCLLYMSVVEMISLLSHLRRIGLPVPTLGELKKFRKAVDDTFSK